MSIMKQIGYAILALATVLACSIRFADAATYGSFAYNEPYPKCDGQDHYVIIDTAHVASEGAGTYPNGGTFTIVGTSIFARSTDPESYAMLGVLGGPGDPLTTYLYGQGTAQWAITYQMQPGYQLHLHYACGPGTTFIPGVVVQYTF